MTETSSDLPVLQAIRLKGRVSPADLAATLGIDDGAGIAAVVARLAAAGLLIDGATVRLTPVGRTRLAELLTAERAGVDPVPMRTAYDEFRPVNRDFKVLITDWQLKDDAPNAHDDAGYDAAVLARLVDVHRQAVPIIEAAATGLPRLRAYATKLTAALDKINAGEHAWLTRPLIDSYHTVWFELHEELIGAVGLTREEAARTGEAQ